LRGGLTPRLVYKKFLNPCKVFLASLIAHPNSITQERFFSASHESPVLEILTFSTFKAFKA